MIKAKLAGFGPFILIALLFGGIYAMMSFANHYYFRTYTLDLGLYTHELYSYSQGRLATIDVINSPVNLALSDHFDLYLILFSPLVKIFGTYTLLVVQLIAVLAGGLGVYRYFEDRKTALLASIFFLSFFGVVSAFAFDYHSNVITAAILPWFFLNLKKERIVPVFLLLAFLLVGKENMPFWMGFVCIGLTITHWNSKLKRNLSIICALISLTFFYLMIGYIMPALSHEHDYLHFTYNVLGSNMSEAFQHLMFHPIDSFKLLFSNHSGIEAANYVKTETHILLLISGVFVLFWRPVYLIMLLPIYFQKFFHDNIVMWSHGAQYSVEFAPIVTIGVFSILGKISHERRKLILGIALTTISIFVTYRTLNHPFYFFPKENVQFYKRQHFEKHYSVKDVYSTLEKIPADAPVSAAFCYVPHLSLRKDIYEYPKIENAEYILISTEESPWPMNQEQFNQQLDTLKQSNYWKTLDSNDHLYLFEKVKR